MDIKECPFCGGNGEVKEETFGHPNFGQTGHYYFYVECTSCKARGGYVRIKYFNEFSEYTVEDFRQNNLVRAVEDEKYDCYLGGKKLETITLWNKRVTFIGTQALNEGN